MMSSTGSARRIWGILKKSVESCGPKKKGDFCLLAKALWRVPHVLGGGRWKSQHRKNLSPYVEKPLNSKVIKSFVPELRSRKCFSCFGIPMFYVYILWTFYVHFTYLYHGYGTLLLLLHNRTEQTNVLTQWVRKTEVVAYFLWK